MSEFEALALVDRVNEHHGDFPTLELWGRFVEFCDVNQE